MSDPWAQFPDAPQAAAGGDPWAQFPDARPAESPSALKQTLMAPVGAAEMGLQGITGGLASIPAGLAYGGAAIAKAAGANVDPSAVQSRVQNALTYQPVSDSGRGGDRALASLTAPIINPIMQKYGEATQAVSQRSPFAGELMKAAPGALQAASSLVPAAAGVRAAATEPFRPTAPRNPTSTAESVLSRLNTKQSLSVADAAPSLTNISPELRQAIVTTAQKTGGAVNQEALGRHIEADTLPVAVRLTEGQALQDPRIISQEMNTRGNTGITEHLAQQNRALAENVRAIRDAVGPDVFSTNAVEHGDALIAAYQAKDAAAEAAISAKYDMLRNAAGGSFPVDSKILLANASKELHGQLLYDHAPKAIMVTLNRLAKTNSMTFENFESLRTNLARIMRSPTADGNEKAAAGIIRDSMEQLPLGPAAAQLKPYADAARMAAKQRFDALKADPAYKAAVNGTVPPDRFTSRFIIQAPRDQLAQMRASLAGNDQALQTLGVAALDHLREQARLNPNYEGNFAAAGFNKALIALSPRLRSLVTPDVSDALERLGNVSRYTTAQPRGSFVNNSNTFVAGAAEYGKGALEGAANVAAHGVPVGTWARRAIASVQQRKAVERSMAPGAGLDRLPERP